MKYAVYFPVVAYPNLTKASWESLLRALDVQCALDVPYTRIFLVADGVRDPAMAQWLQSVIEQQNSKVNIEWSRDRHGSSRCLNAVIKQLDTDEDLLVACSTALYFPQWISTFLQYRDHPNVLALVAGELKIPPTLPDKILEAYQNNLRYVISSQTVDIEQFVNQFLSHFGYTTQKSFTSQHPQNVHLPLRTGDLGHVFYLTSQCLHSVGYFDERLQSGNEFDYSTRITMLDKLILHVDDTPIWKVGRHVTSEVFPFMPDKFLQAFQDKYHGVHAETWKTIEGYRQRQLAFKPQQDYVLVGDQRLPVHHST